MRLPRLYPILDTAALQFRACPILDAAEAFLEAGVEILQFRHKEHYSREVFAAAGQIGRLCREAGTLFIIDDRADIALMLDAGLHLGQEDLEPSRARSLIGARPLGFSTHNGDQLRASAAEPVDYIALGPIFGTGSKRNPDPFLGIGELARLRLLTSRPMVAIGGITRASAVEVLAGG